MGDNAKEWHGTKSDDESKSFRTEFWAKHANDISSGDFWADKIKSFRGEPLERLKLALENLPLPAAFREAMIATRALIREKRKSNQEYEDQLALLYWLAAIDSFSVDYSEELDGPGYNIIESIPGEILKGLPFNYETLGYEELKLVNSTDKKWITQAWGEPSGHTTLHELHKDVWQKYEQKLKIEREERFETLFKSKKNSETSPKNISKNLELSVDDDNKPMGLFTKFAFSVLTIIVIAAFLT